MGGEGFEVESDELFVAEGRGGLNFLVCGLVFEVSGARGSLPEEFERAAPEETGTAGFRFGGNFLW